MIVARYVDRSPFGGFTNNTTERVMHVERSPSDHSYDDHLSQNGIAGCDLSLKWFNKSCERRMRLRANGVSVKLSTDMRA